MRAILLEQQQEVALVREARLDPGRLKTQQRVQSLHRWRICPRRVGDQLTQSEGLMAQILADCRLSLGRTVSLVEHQVQPLADRLAALWQMVWVGYFKRLF